MKTPRFLLIAGLLVGTSVLACAQGYTGYTGDQEKDSLSPGWTEWATSTGTCLGVYYPRAFGMSVRFYSACGGFNGGLMTAKTYLPDIRVASIYGDATAIRQIDGAAQYVWHAYSRCDTGTGNVADVVVTEDVDFGC
jgi:hypothetical protein